MMKTKTLKTACIVLISLFCITASTACYAQEDTVVIKKQQFEEAIVLMAQGQNATRYADTLKKWYKEDMDSANTHIKLLLKTDSAARVYEQKLQEQIAALEMNRDYYYSKYQAEHAKQGRAFGIGPELGYNPFAKKMYFGVGVHLSIVKFSLFKSNSETGSTPAQPTGGTLSDRLRGGN